MSTFRYLICRYYEGWVVCGLNDSGTAVWGEMGEEF